LQISSRNSNLVNDMQYAMSVTKQSYSWMISEWGKILKNIWYKPKSKLLLVNISNNNFHILFVYYHYHYWYYYYFY
jgi:hypothetical protein